MNILRPGLLLVLWSAALYGGLCLNELDLGHSVCGPWGCGPPSAALLAMHTFWLLTLVPAAFVAVRISPGMEWRMIGLGLLTTAVVAIVMIGVADYFMFQKDYLSPVYVWQRFLYRLATLSDVPVVQLALAGLALANLGRRK